MFAQGKIQKMYRNEILWWSYVHICILAGSCLFGKDNHRFRWYVNYAQQKTKFIAQCKNETVDHVLNMRYMPWFREIWLRSLYKSLVIKSFQLKISDCISECFFFFFYDKCKKREKYLKDYKFKNFVNSK